MEYIVLQSLVEDGLSTYEIAQKVNLGQTTVRYWLKKFDLKTDITKKQGNGTCEHCDKPLKGRQIRFCSKRCKRAILNDNERTYRNQKQRRYARKKYFVALLGEKCSQCGFSQSYTALSFHHKDKMTKTDNLPNMFHNKTLATCEKEAAKCKLLCENCHRELHSKKEPAASYKKQKETLLAKRQVLIDKLGGKCQQCGYDKCSSALDFHHLRDKKYSLTIREMASAIPFEEFEKEIDKCVLLCANCHLQVHEKERTVSQSISR